MENETVIIDYGMGNVASVQKALNYLQIPNAISNNPVDIKHAKYLILPGVGSFKQGMENLEKSGLVSVLNEEVIIKGKPILGICLGMQLFATLGTEPVETNGLNWIKGKVNKIQERNLRIPHLGWNTVNFKEESFIDFNQKDFYFIHSYHFEVEEMNSVLATVDYGNQYVAAIQRDNIMATQFHPEKSQEVGLKLIKHFFDIYA